jgi:hypothetical protein
MRTYTARIYTESWVAEVVRWLVGESQWFQVEPLPDEAWDITVKAEFADRLAAYLEAK